MVCFNGIYKKTKCLSLIIIATTAKFKHFIIGIKS